MIATAEAIQSHTRLPENEIYGRSLSTIRRLGAAMIGRPDFEAISSPEAAQARVEFFTSVEEGFGTDMELGGGLEVRDFDSRPVIDGRVMAKDLKTPISDMTYAGLLCGKKTADKDIRFNPQLTRSYWDHENAVAVDAMAQGKTTYNTRVVVSPFPEEAAAQSGNEYWRSIGYVPHLKRGFVQLYHTTEDGVISGSLSFDGCDKRRLREVFTRYGVQIPETETTDNWLKYSVTRTLSAAEAKELAIEIADLAADPSYSKNTNTVDVTHEYKSIMDNVFNDSYVHVCESLYRGCQTPGARELILQLANKAHDFNSRYADALYRMRSDERQFTDDDSVVLHELLVYSTIEMMRALHLGTKTLARENSSKSYGMQQDIAYLQSLDSVSFRRMLGDFGAGGARSGRAYSACGLEIAPGEHGPDGNPQSVFGGLDNKSSTDYDKFGPLEFTCKNGHWNIRPRGALITQCRFRHCKNSVSC